MPIFNIFLLHRCKKKVLASQMMKHYTYLIKTSTKKIYKNCVQPLKQRIHKLQWIEIVSNTCSYL